MQAMVSPETICLEISLTDMQFALVLINTHLETLSLRWAKCPTHQIPSSPTHTRTHADICELEVIAIGTNSKYVPRRFKGVTKEGKTLFTLIYYHPAVDMLIRIGIYKEL